MAAEEHGEAGATSLIFRKMTTEDRMLLDAGHDLSAIPDAKAFFAGSETGKVRRATLELRDEMHCRLPGSLQCGRGDCHMGLVVSRRGRAQLLALHDRGACAPAGS